MSEIKTENTTEGRKEASEIMAELVRQGVLFKACIFQGVIIITLTGGY